jgi:septum formation protein
MLILASNSPRRKQLLSFGGWKFSVQAPQVDESVQHHELPEAYVIRLAEQKAMAVYAVTRKLHGIDIPVDDTLILAADTIVVDKDENGEWTDILGKPVDVAHAESMLLRLRGRVHQVFSGLALLRASDHFRISHVVFTEVLMRPYSLKEIHAYITTGDPIDKAGAYAIQHPTFQPVQNLQGCYANVMGLPICQAAQMLTEMGCPPDRDIVIECQQALAITCKISWQFLKVGQRPHGEEI